MDKIKEVHVFVGKARASTNNEFNYPEGEVHGLLIFSCQETGTDHDWEKAENYAIYNGWFDIELTRGGTLSEAPDSDDEIKINCYQQALQYGSAMIVYSGPET